MSGYIYMSRGEPLVNAKGEIHLARKNECRDASTRWHNLFGTPERAARTMARMCVKPDGNCVNCPAFDEGLAFCEYVDGYEFSLLEWLRGDA